MLLPALPADAKELTRAEWAKQASSICGSLREEMRKLVAQEVPGLGLGVRAGSPEAKARDKKVAPYLSDYYSKLASALNKLEAPKADRPMVKKVVLSFRAAAVRVRNNPVALGAELTKDAEDALKALGFTKCGAP